MNTKQYDPNAADLDGKNIIIVGGTGGLGRATAQSLAARGADVTVVGQTFRDAGQPNISFIKADLSLLSEAKRVARELPAEMADILIFTAGIFAAPQRQENREGIELDLAVSYLNRMVMLREMAPRLGTGRAPGSPKPRVFNMAFPGNGQLGTPEDLNAERSYKAMTQHMNTVAGNEILSLDAVERYPNIDSFALNPGIVKTNIRSNYLGNGWLSSLIEGVVGIFNATPEQYAARIVPLLVSPSIEGHSGAMFDKKGKTIQPTAGLTKGHIAKFLAASEALVARAGVPLSA